MMLLIDVREVYIGLEGFTLDRRVSTWVTWELTSLTEDWTPLAESKEKWTHKQTIY